MWHKNSHWERDSDDGLGSSTVFSESSHSWATCVPDLVSTVVVAIW